MASITPGTVAVNGGLNDMVCIVLAAGYATRLYPLTENFPKPLLKVKDKTILDWLLDDIDGSGFVDRAVVVSNHRYYQQFQEWAATKRIPLNTAVLDDGSLSNEQRLGAVNDILFAMDTLRLDDDILVVAGDNLLDFTLSGFLAYAKRKAASCVMRYHERDVRMLRQSGVVEVDDEDRVTRMEEKPGDPFANWCVPAFYFYRRCDLPWIRKAVEAGCGTDAPGSLVVWLASVIPIHAMVMPGRRYDIGDVKSYQAACAGYPGIKG